MPTKTESELHFGIVLVAVITLLMLMRYKREKLVGHPLEDIQPDWTEPPEDVYMPVYYDAGDEIQWLTRRAHGNHYASRTASHPSVKMTPDPVCTEVCNSSAIDRFAEPEYIGENGVIYAPRMFHH